MEHKSSRAFQTARIGECGGNDIEIRETEGTVVEQPSWSTVHTFEMLPAASSGRSATAQPSGSPRRSTVSTTRSVKYVNSAVSMLEKNEDSCSHVDGTSVSSCSSDIVPPLDLKSICYSSPRDGGGYTFYYDNYGEPTKLKGNPSLAYENWLSAKRRIISDKAAKRKREEETKVRQKEERKRLAAEKYQKWLESKQQQERLNKPKTKLSIVGQNNKKRHATTEVATTAQPPMEQPMPMDTRQEKIIEWERNKRLEEEKRRKKKKLEKEKREREEEKRRQLAQEAWDKWISEAPNKPKPVPLNRGLFTLRGTISDIFINPNEWKSGDGDAGDGL